MENVISGWGLTPKAHTDLIEVDFDAKFNFKFPGNLTIARGMGRSYGDAAQISGGVTCELAGPRNYVVDFNSLIVTSDAAVTIDNLIANLAPKGLFVPVTPGTRYVSIGGAIASDVHGKNHHAAGSFTDSVVSIKLLTPAGLIECSRELSPDIFWATCGGMGLTGFIVEAKIQFQSIHSTYMDVDTFRVGNLSSLMAKMSEIDSHYPYTVAWLDTLSKGSSLGRGIISAGLHLDMDRSDSLGNKQWLYKGEQKISYPKFIRTNFVNSVSARAFNEAWFRKAPKEKLNEIQSIPKFFHPLDGVRNWNHVYGKSGFIQYQFVVPYSESEFVELVVKKLSHQQIPVFLGVLKRFGSGNNGFLSFPTPGWTLAVDIPAGVEGLAGLLDKLDEELVSRGGRIYLSKDARMKPEHLKAMYPKVEQLLHIKANLDPHNVIQSNLSRRLGIC